MAQDNLDAPPPPYSETDIYSNSGRVYSNPSVAGGDDHTSTTTSERVLTPPDTPRTNSGSHVPPPPSLQHSHHSSSHAHGGVNTNGFAQAAAAAAVDVSPAVADYFTSRSPPSADLPADGVLHTIRIDQNTLPDDLPYHHEWASRDVLPLDWATFINFLIPDHATRGNQIVLDRKIEEERQSEAAARVTAASQTGSDESWAHISGLSQAEAQRDSLREDEAGHPETDQTERMFNAAVTVQQWNEGFFGPRKMTVHMEGNISQRGVPGSWDDGFDQSVSGSSYVTATAPDDAASTAPHDATNTAGWRGYLGGGLRVDDEGIRLGDSFVADSNGLKIGSIIMDSNGIRIGVSGDYPGRAEPSQNSVGRQPSSADRGEGRDLSSGAHAGGRRGGRGGFLARQQLGAYHRGEPSHHQHWSDHHRSWDHHHHGHDHGVGHAHSHHDGRAEGRWKGKGRESHGVRGRHHGEDGHERRRDASVSSVSSSSSSSSSSSGGSIGSLPAYDDIQPQALPSYVKRLESWLAHSEHEFTKEDVKSFKSEMKELKSLPPDPSIDVKSLRAKAKEARAQWKNIKKAQRRGRRERKREKRSIRRSERKERRDAKRDARRTKREIRRGKATEKADAHHHHPTSMHIPPIPPIPPVPPVAPIPAIPSLADWHPFHSGAAAGPFGGPGRGGRGFGRGFGRGGRGFGGGFGGPRGFGRGGGRGVFGAPENDDSGGRGSAPRAPFSPFGFFFNNNNAAPPAGAGESSHSHDEPNEPPSYDGPEDSPREKGNQEGGYVPQRESTMHLYARVSQLEAQIHAIGTHAQRLQDRIDTLDSQAEEGGSDSAGAEREALRSAKAGLDKQIEVLREQLDNAAAGADEELPRETDSTPHP